MVLFSKSQVLRCTLPQAPGCLLSDYKVMHAQIECRELNNVITKSIELISLFHPKKSSRSTLFLFDNFPMKPETTYEGCLSNEGKVGNEVRQGGITTGILFNFYLNEVLTDLPGLSLGCKLNHNRVNIFCFGDDIALLPPTENALQFMLDTLPPKLENLSLKINVEKSCNTVFKHKRSRISADL